MERKLISFDWAIKRLLRSKANFVILEGFLSELLFEDITIIDILESESNRIYGDNKLNRVDIKVKDSKEEIIIIEIQYDREFDYLQRMLYSTSKVVSEHIKKGDSFSTVKKVISINILYFDFGDGDDYVYHGKTSFIGLHTKTELKLNKKQEKLYKTDLIEKIYPEYYLLKIRNFNDVAKNSLDEWIYFLKNEKVKNNFKAKGLVEAKEILDYLKMPEKEQLEYDKYQDNLRNQASMYESTYVSGKIEGIIEGKREGIIEGIIEGKREGIIEGEKKKSYEFAKKCLLKGMKIDLIIDLTGLSKIEIEGL